MAIRTSSSRSETEQPPIAEQWKRQREQVDEILQREQRSGAHVVIEVHIQSGRIERIQEKRSIKIT